ncbi:uncharacterized protein BJ171DRAFT_614470 [Polychytrium aggregatum]|uniref:uncharacterized protein n=1 Tax=Polychytrium aggregatum TaxID=110093 RepID=UPI0022FDECF9|nr:uncharacterized protein BJ171DRAFT_614470 [Polychytrium aggregatum]KAI9190761.1 hypothetical protein BJ171DRAFT_614470 [Polychytrium aggregatum]
MTILNSCLLWLLPLLSGLGAFCQQPNVIIGGIGSNPPSSLFLALSGVYSNYDPGWDYNYTNAGSGAARAALAAGAPNLTWAAIDVIPSNVSYTGPGNTLGHFVPVPVAASCIAIVYHLNVTNLTLTRQNLADIFSGKIAFWNDTRLTQNNPNLTTITARIQTIVNSGTAGLTANFLSALNKFDPTLNLTGTRYYPLPTWGPANTPLYGSSDSILSDGVQVVPFSIGYVDLPYVNATLSGMASSFNLYGIANIINKNGDTVAPSVQTMKASAIHSPLPVAALSSPITTNISALRHISNDIGNAIQSSYLDSSVPNAYPLMEPTFFILRQDSQLYGVSAAEIQATLRFLFWIIFGGTQTTLSTEPIASPSTATYFNQYNFVHYTDPNIRQFAYDAFMLVTQGGQSLYDPTSPCNPYFDSNNIYVSASSCKHGYCIIDGPFQSSSIIECICDVGYYNNQQLDCSEPSAPFMIHFNNLDSDNIVMLVLLIVTVLINTGILTLIVLWRKKPDIQAISPNCCYVIMAGALFGQVAALFFSADPSPLVCAGRIFLPVIAFSSVFSMLLMKSIRIYIIFGYKRIRTIKTPDWKLILASAMIVGIEIVVCVAWVAIGSPTAVVEGSFYALVCASAHGSMAAPEILIYVLNGAILIGCVVFAYLTRGAHERFQESRVIGLCSYVVSMTLLLCLPMVYALSEELSSQGLYVVGRIILSCLVIMVSSLIPIILFSTRLFKVLQHKPVGNDSEKQTQRSSPAATNRSSVTSQGMARASIVAYAYDCGLQGLKFGGAWVSSTVLVFTNLDLIEMRESDMDGTIQVSFRFSSCECELCDPESDPDAEKVLARSVRVRRNKVTYTLEFGSKDTAGSFMANYADVKAKAGTAAVKGVGGISGLGGAAKRDKTVFGLLEASVTGTNEPRDRKSANDQSE